MIMSAMCVAASVMGAPDADLRVMVWNVLHGANDVEQGPEKALQAIRDAEADIVLLQESYDIDGDRPRLGEWLAGELGWSQHQAESKHLCVLTRLDVEATFFHHAWHGVGAKLRDDEGRELLAWSIWIDWRSYITHDLRDNPGMSDEELLAAESERSNRAPQAAAILEHLRQSGQLEADIPLLVGGDWNCPSHLDWTADTAMSWRYRRDLPLPVSTMLQEAGFTDTFRAVHPNPVQRPGITWSPMFRGNSPSFRGETKKPEGLERIDRLYLRNPGAPAGGWSLRAADGRTLPEIWEAETVPLEKRAWPSDHGAVVIDLEWAQATTAVADSASAVK